MSVIFHCKISVSTDYSEYADSDAEVFAAIEEAKAWGLEEISKRVQTLVDKNIPVDYDEECTESRIDDWRISFVIYEVDPAYREKTGEQAEWRFDRHGNIADRLYWADKNHCYCRMPGDDEPSAGKKFQIGDYVTYKEKDERKKSVYVVCGIPRKQRSENWTNLYDLWGIRHGKLVSFVDSGADFGTHESLLTLYDNEISDDNPLHFLHMIALGEIKPTDGEWFDLREGRIVLNEEPFWRETLAKVWRKE